MWTIYQQNYSVLSDKAATELKNICMKTEDGAWPEDFHESIIVPIKKQPHTLECKDHRLLILIYTSKIILRILTRRLERQADKYIGSDITY